MTEVPAIVKDALEGNQGEDQHRIARTFIEQLEKALRKNHDYGNTVFRNPVLAPSLEPESAILVRLSDKIDRFSTLRTRDAKVSESLEDTAGDAGTYFFLWLVQKQREKAGDVDSSKESRASEDFRPE